MLKSWLGLKAAVLGLAIHYTGSALACSILPPDVNLIKSKFRTAVAGQLSLAVSQVPSYKLTPPKLSFLRPLGADCSNIDTAYHASAYNFKRTYPSMTCEHKGVVILKTLLADGPIEVLDSTTCLGNPIGPIYNFSGLWKNIDINSNYITKFAVSSNGHHIRVWGKCHPTDCDWGYVPLRPAGAANKKKAVFVHGSKTRTLTLIHKGDEVELQTVEKTIVGGNPISSIRLDTFKK